MLSNSSNVYYNSLKLLDTLSKPCSLQSKIVLRKGNCVISAMIFLLTLSAFIGHHCQIFFVLHLKNSCLLQTINLKLHATSYHMQLLSMVFFATTFDLDIFTTMLQLGVLSFFQHDEFYYYFHS
jgi:hypothetical protein